MDLTELPELAMKVWDAMLLLAGAWLTSCVFLIGALALEYILIPVSFFRSLSEFTARGRAAIHFMLFGGATSASDLMSAFVLLVLMNENPVGAGILSRMFSASVLSSLTVWGAVGCIVGPWLERRRYKLAIEEAVAFAIFGVLAARVAMLIQVALTGPVSEHAAVSNMFKVNTAYLGPNFVVLMIAFSVHRAGVRRVLRALERGDVDEVTQEVTQEISLGVEEASEPEARPRSWFNEK